ncbi:CbtB domain-containing protein [Caenimonas soli]|uniref:CbtB domain-containing protein n=1 Tax=Caenimonas soli TaxID=2735555 RepID=UPI001551A053|nr:CbtB domain-containing protein [Caenimonas soli]NPC58304.1 CbtB-domain containing protein [Caenimonas soli]
MQNSAIAASAATTVTDGARSARSKCLFEAVLAAVFGTVILWAVGFSPIEVVHDAAHDVRHANGFPCH